MLGYTLSPFRNMLTVVLRVMSCLNECLAGNKPINEQDPPSNREGASGREDMDQCVTTTFIRYEPIQQ